MPRIVWSEQARDDLRGIKAYIGQDSPEAADKFVQRLTDRTRSLQQFPLMGAIIAEDDTATYREVLEGSYRIIYRVDEDAVQIAMVFHGARLLRWEDLDS
jgi:toxin ParE1/3/4